jgi:colanic acid/amylovoran biosynthesis glycosyltransferase
MKIAYVVDSWPRLSETFVVREIAAAAARHEVRILALEPGDATAADPEAAGLADRVRVLPARDGGLLAAALAHPVRFARALAAARRGRAEGTMRRLEALLVEAAALRAWGVDRVHAHFARWATAAAEVLAAWTGAPFGFTAHAYDVFRDPVRIEDKARRAAWAVACTEAARAEIERRHGPATAARFRVIRHGLDLSAWRPGARAARAGGPLRVLAVGRLVRKKGFDVLLEAVKAASERGDGVVVRIVGAGEEEAALRAAIDRLGVRGAVSLEGAVSPDAVRERLRDWADVVAVPSRVEADGDRDGLPNVVGEAMACGVPVVGTPVGGILEMLTDGETGLVVPAEDAGALADALVRLAADPGLARRLGERARAKAETTFDLERNVAALLSLIENRGGEASGTATPRHK